MTMDADIPVALEFRDIRHSFAAPPAKGRPGRVVPVIADISLSVGAGRFTAVVGPSGCGKSTLLQFAAGLLRPSGGTVSQFGAPITGVNDRIGFVPQQAMLFPWYTLRQNVELPLLLRDVPAAERRARCDLLLRQVGLAGFEDHFPHQLSGGMQKRASIIRTLIYEPDIVLMDEPFGALDAQTRLLMHADLLRLWERRRSTILFVTHDLVEAITLADNVVLLSRRPTVVKADFQVPLPRPRDVFEPFKMPGFTAAYEEVWRIFRTEVVDDAA
ncbi:MAG TPA: ABC transporter ATP-binding protein [Stellaceae bacterium]|nr:ABC transporter ATP-binding protein [Stellaceae bacterium]